MLCQQVEVLKQSVLTNFLSAALPSYELKLSNPLVGFKIKGPASISSAERDVLDFLTGVQDMWQTKEYSQCMYHHVDLPGNALHGPGCSEDIILGSAAYQGIRTGIVGYASQGSLNLGEGFRQVSSSELLQCLNGVE
jgi:hypothetical protein